MINHQHKIIFIHIPKCAGTSITNFFFDIESLDWKEANYDLLYGWCPKRKLHLQHATPLELLETGLITQNQWDTYYKFTVVRNPWDRAYSDYLWIKNSSKKKGSFKNFIQAKGAFLQIMRNNNTKKYRGDHLQPQTKYLNTQHYKPLDSILRFENLNHELNQLFAHLKLDEQFNLHNNKGKKKHAHYSTFYTKSNKQLVAKIYQQDIALLQYHFEDKKTGWQRIKNYL